MTRPRTSAPYATVNDVIAAGAAFFRTSVADLVGRDRSRPLVWYRQATMAACRQVTPHSYPAIAWAFGRDHTTVIHAVQRADRNGDVRRLAAGLVARILEDRAA